MKLNHDCVRDVLLFTEEIGLNDTAFADNLFNSDRLKKYSQDDITYTVLKLVEADYLSASIPVLDDEYQLQFVSALTWQGHQFLDNIRSDTVWHKTKTKVAESIGSASVSILSQVAASFVKSMLGLN